MINSTITPEPTLTGIRFGNRIIGYSTAVRQIDNGNYDKRIPDGLDLIACIMEGIESGWFMPCIEKQIILWRWLVVAVFIAEEQEKNGTVDVQNDKGGVDTAVVYTGKPGSISIYPWSERFALANHIEAGAIEKYGPDVGQQMALRMYQDMVVTDEKCGFRLSAMGREGFNILHDSFIELIQKDGMPDMPVMH